MGTGPKVVVSLHGIRTKGAWQESLSRLLGQAGYSYDPWKFGFFRAISMVNPRARREKVNWFLERYSRLRSETDEPISIVAHSFGSYILAAALRQYPQIKFDRIILCGSIVPVDYDWESVILKRGQASVVLNQFGRRDIWVRLAEWVVSDAGPSGHQGFKNTVSGRVTQQDFADYTHSQYFYDLNFKENWIPFLRTGRASPQVNLVSGKVNWKFRLVLAIALVVLAALAAISVIDLPNRPKGTRSSSKFSSDSREVVGPADDGKGTSDPVSDTNASGADAPTASDQKPVTVAFLSDAECQLILDDQDIGVISRSSKREISIERGDHRVKCVARDDREVTYEQSISVAGSNQVVRIAIAQQVEERRQAMIKVLVDHTWKVVHGEWEAQKSNSKELPQVNCKQTMDLTTRIRVDELDNHVAKGTFHESYRSQSVLVGDFPFTEEKYCNNLINGDNDIEIHTLERSGTVTFDLSKAAGGAFPAVLDVTSCVENGQSCDADDFGAEDVDASVTSNGDKLLFGDVAYQRL